ncbi:MAG: tetratricopeptide repeat protein [Bdellovibrionales bacterium]
MQYLLSLFLVLITHSSLALKQPKHLADLKKLHESGKDLYKNKNANYESFKKVFDKKNFYKVNKESFYKNMHKNTDFSYKEKYLKPLAQKGNPKDQVRLGLAYYHESQKEKSLEWMKKAAKQNDAEAQFYLAALFYKEGTFVKRDNKKAMNIMFKSATKGLAKAQFVFGSWLEDLLDRYPEYADKNPVEWKTPAYWMKKAAKQDHTAAQAVLAYYYLFGIYNIEQDNVRAYAWAHRALTNDSSFAGEKFEDFMQNKLFARKILAESTKGMDADTIGRAQKLSYNLRKYAKNVHNQQVTKDIIAGSIVTYITWRIGGRMVGGKILRKKFFKPRKARSLNQNIKSRVTGKTQK